MEDILAVSIPIVGFICLIAIIRSIGENRLKRRLAETHASADLVRAFTDAEIRMREHNSLKWGILFVLTSVAFLLIELLDFKAQDPGAFGLLFGAVGIGLLTLHFLRKNRG